MIRILSSKTTVLVDELTAVMAFAFLISAASGDRAG
jgi:hypothetical protein